MWLAAIVFVFAIAALLLAIRLLRQLPDDTAPAERYRSRGGPNLHAAPIRLPPTLRVGVWHHPLGGETPWQDERYGRMRAQDFLSIDTNTHLYLECATLARAASPAGAVDIRSR